MTPHWILCEAALPVYPAEVVCWVEGTKFHSDCGWKREGYALMRIFPDGWNQQDLEAAAKKIDADEGCVTVKAWMPLRETATQSPQPGAGERG